MVVAVIMYHFDLHLVVLDSLVLSVQQVHTWYSINSSRSYQVLFMLTLAAMPVSCAYECRVVYTSTWYVSRTWSIFIECRQIKGRQHSKKQLVLDVHG